MASFFLVIYIITIIPSPNKIECNQGNLDSFTKFKIATVSVAHKTKNNKSFLLPAEKSNNSRIYNFFPKNISVSFKSRANEAMQKKDIIVPRIP